MTTTATQPEERVLSNLNADGSRRWIKPSLSTGRFWKRRRAVAYLLIALFTAIPYIRVNGRPAMLLDIVHREFTFLGATFYPTDTLLLALLIVGAFVTVFGLTALFGRVWCGWACPQTVYMEFVFRPIERWLEGAPGRKRKEGDWRRAAKFLIYIAISMYLAHTFLSYFVGVEQLARWVRGSPAKHPTAFVLMAATTVLMLIDFGFFREYTCIVACPYGRFQSVMLDRQSMAISYDRGRGEPRGKLRRHTPTGDLSLNVLPPLGDCIDCRKCVTTCPTGIDIRDGLQMECVNCAQCIDACDEVMDKIGRPRGLVRYTSQAALEGESIRVARPRLVVYSLVLMMVAIAFITVLSTRTPALVTVLRGRGMPFTQAADGSITNVARVKVLNRTRGTATYSFQLLDPPGGAVQFAGENTLDVSPGKWRTETMSIVVPPRAFASGRCDAVIRVTSTGGYTRDVRYRLLGPYSPAHHPEKPNG